MIFLVNKYSFSKILKPLHPFKWLLFSPHPQILSSHELHHPTCDCSLLLSGFQGFFSQLEESWRVSNFLVNSSLSLPLPSFIIASFAPFIVQYVSTHCKNKSRDRKIRWLDYLHHSHLLGSAQLGPMDLSNTSKLEQHFKYHSELLAGNPVLRFGSGLECYF